MSTNEQARYTAADVLAMADEIADFRRRPKTDVTLAPRIELMLRVIAEQAPAVAGLVDDAKRAVAAETGRRCADELESALSAPEPAAQGDLEPCEGVMRAQKAAELADKAAYAKGYADGLAALLNTYTAPPAQPAEGMPEGKTEDYYAEFGTYEKGHMTGWNDYRRAMLAASPAPSEGGEGVEGDAARFRFVVEHNWIGAKTRCAEGIQDSDIESARRAVDRAMLTAAPAPGGKGAHRTLAKYQPCGCVICTCEDEVQCHGCGAHHCGAHPVAEFDNPVYTTGAAR